MVYNFLRCVCIDGGIIVVLRTAAPLLVQIGYKLGGLLETRRARKVAAESHR